MRAYFKRIYYFIIKNKIYLYFFYVLGFALLMKFSVFFVEKQEKHFIIEGIKQKIFPQQNISIHKVLLQSIDLKDPLYIFYNKENSLQGYAYTMEYNVYGYLVKGWLFFDSHFILKDYNIYYWEAHSSYVDLLSKGVFKHQMIINFNQSIPFLLKPSIYYNMDFFMYKEYLDQQNLINAINFLNEDIMMVIFKLQSLSKNWEQNPV